MPRRLTKLRVDEVSLVDKAANQHARIAFWKRDDVERAYRKIFGVSTPGDALRAALHKAAAKSALPKPKDLADDEADDVHEGDDGEEADDETEVAASKHLLQTIAGLLVQAGSAPDQQSALFRLMHTARGAELFRRLNKLRKEKTMPDSIDAVIQDYGVVRLAKSIAEGGSTGGMSEHDFVAAVDAFAKSKGSNFVAMYTAQDDDGLAIRRATQILKGFGTTGPMREAVAGGDAYQALEMKASDLRKRDPTLTKEQAFAKAFSAPENRALAAAERAANRPVA
jgi:hypothetical protein